MKSMHLFLDEWIELLIFFEEGTGFQQLMKLL